MQRLRTRFRFRVKFALLRFLFFSDLVESLRSLRWNPTEGRYRDGTTCIKQFRIVKIKEKKKKPKLLKALQITGNFHTP